jgi:hypothetical protein
MTRGGAAAAKEQNIPVHALAGIAMVRAEVALTRLRAKPASDEPDPRPKI